MTMIPNAAAIAAVNAYNDSPFAETTLQGMNRALEAALPYLPTVESLGLFTHPDHPGWVAMPDNVPGFVRVHKKELRTFAFYGANINEWTYADVDYHEAAQFARAYFQAHAPKCGEPCPFMNGLHCVLDPHDDGAHRVVTASGMTVTWIEAD